MKCAPRPQRLLHILSIALFATLTPSPCSAHGTVVSPASRVYRVYQSNPERPNFALARNAVMLDGTSSYYTWNEVSRNIPQAVLAGLPPGFDYSTWIPDGQLASAGRVDPNSTLYPRTYAGLDQVSADWPTTAVVGGTTLPIDFMATASHSPSVWDVWMTRPTWDASTALTWSEMEFLARPNVSFSGGHYRFDLDIPSDRIGHHVLWIAWQRDDSAGEVFISTCDVDVRGSFATVSDGCGQATLTASGSPQVGGQVNLAVANAAGSAQALWLGGRAQLTPLCSLCDLGVSIDAARPGSVSFSIPGMPSFIGSSLFVQGVDALGTSGGCLLGGGIDFTLTETLRISIGQ